MTVSSYHSSLSASINLCGPGAVSSLRPASLQSLLVPGLDFSKARCLLATGGGFRLSGPFQTPIFNAVLIRSSAVEYFHLLGSQRLLISRVSPWGRRFRQEGVAMKKTLK